MMSVFVRQLAILSITHAFPAKEVAYNAKMEQAVIAVILISIM
jgi:hypothetical protein